ncbi:FadR family transcriptional regulator [Exiguobacterium sp. SH3S2]|uniref:FadR/GntR family transcriptional regulator n=1 Tax=unclassified Exiguobacterium TaxID=2644629 RepID=UPI0010402AF4|nr:MULTISPECIES: GntR family transcriptional regulator [unclassified Exiguobacterium]TCI48799.1 FadR family transcriptional regulator [Exiguobacterium sp. SH3S3]TCI55637.1 FadR family transcriptional regulator [Exiguobacterium sp. SH5S13]TCI27843.1 FadR family transcriptional regulator [Exiguobacterium sp. SH5S4]TCI63663.1 FadR family transcriptional regulator [Exiguobacterium sp. SH3S2]TCI64786.1 FadR family transcriptional regulator [Exiguobacterium sp. SH3S1]
MHGKYASSFHENISKIRSLIVQASLAPGDRLPSERELAETLSISRASVREALRALSFLGIVETRHGGGTFLCEQDRHRYIEILSEFIVTKQTKASDIVDVLRLLERLAFSEVEPTPERVKLLEVNLANDREFRQQLILGLGNELFIRIWSEVNRFYDGTDAGELYTIEERTQLLEMWRKVRMPE